jgi:tetratricopeptide (TPR) repeat protein
VEELEGNEKGETLMSRMIGESTIPLSSEMYDAGTEQFEGNLDDILKMFTDENVPVIIGTLTSNTLDQKPFVSVKYKNLPPADSIYNLAVDNLESGHFQIADSLFLFAKELDALRFRAPKKMNEIIFKLSRKYNIPIAKIDSAFRNNSPKNIVGYNLTVDHLHPTIDGYKLIAETFFNKMEELKLLPDGEKRNLTDSEADSILTANFPFTEIDSTLAEMQIARLTGGFPFVPKGTPNYKMQNFNFDSYADSLCLKVIREEIKWEIAHSEMAEWYFNRGNYDAFIKEINTVIEERPYFDQPYEYMINKLTSVNLAEKAFPYVKKLHTFKPGYLTYKWLGQINLHRKNSGDAIKYLSKAIEYTEADYQTWYNLAGAYYLNHQIENAIFAIEKSLELNPNNPIAQNFFDQLKL